MSEPAKKQQKTDITLELQNRAVSVSDMMFGASGIGCMYADVPADQAKSTIEKALEAGIRAYDTAPWYGAGLSESRLGEYIRGQTIVPVTELTVYTKAGRVIKHKEEVSKDTPGVEWNCWDYFMSEPYNHTIPMYDATSEGVKESVKQSGERLGVPIKCMRLHDAETEERWKQATEGGGVDALIQLKKEGKFEQLSLGMNDASYLEKYVDKYPGSFDNIMMAGCWNLLDQTGYDFLVKCQKQGIKVHVAGIFGSGILWGSTHYKYGDIPKDIADKATSWEELCKKYDLTLPKVAIAFGFLPTCVEYIAVGMKKPHYVDSNVATCGVKVPVALWDEAREKGLMDSRIVVPND